MWNIRENEYHFFFGYFIVAFSVEAFEADHHSLI
jgi:hypothetical protein